jgi:hypothetical protein
MRDSDYEIRMNEVILIAHWPPTMSDIADAFAALEKHLCLVDKLDISEEALKSLRSLPDFASQYTPASEDEPATLWTAEVHVREDPEEIVGFSGTTADGSLVRRVTIRQRSS